MTGCVVLWKFWFSSLLFIQHLPELPYQTTQPWIRLWSQERIVPWNWGRNKLSWESYPRSYDDYYFGEPGGQYSFSKDRQVLLPSLTHGPHLDTTLRLVGPWVLVVDTCVIIRGHMCRRPGREGRLVPLSPSARIHTRVLRHVWRAVGDTSWPPQKKQILGAKR